MGHLVLNRELAQAMLEALDRIQRVKLALRAAADQLERGVSICAVTKTVEEILRL